MPNTNYLESFLTEAVKVSLSFSLPDDESATKEV